MQSRWGVDGRQGARTIVELKSAPREASRISPLRVAGVISSRAQFVSSGRRAHLIGLLACLVIGGAVVSGFLRTMAILSASIAVALIVFVLVIQVPLGILVHRWRNRRRNSRAQRRSPRRAPSSGI